MNTTLTGLGIALVVALATALIGPFFVDWGSHRAAFEAQASRLVGVPVRVLGDVEARLLPSPRIRFGQVVAGDEWAASKFTADSFELDIALMPLLSGEYQLTSLRIDGADLKASLAADGEISLPIATDGVTVADLEAVKIADLELRRSRLTVADPAANRNIVVENLALKGEASSLAGPLKFGASGELGGRPYSARVATGRFDRTGLGQVKFTVESKGTPTLDLDGTLLLASKPQFDGTASLALGPAGEGEPAREPWKIAGTLKADVRRLESEKVEIGYGAAGRDLRLTGAASVAFGPKPSADIRVKSRQIDLDRALGRPKDVESLPPAEVLRLLGERLPTDAATPMPVRLAAEVESVVLGGDVVQGVKAVLSSAPGGWNVDEMSARLPGGTALEASGALLVRDGEGPRFNGPVKLDASNVPSLAHWLNGLGGGRPNVALKKLNLDAVIAARPGSYALEDMTASADGAEIKGRLAFTRGTEGRSKVEARLSADRLDLDAIAPGRLLASVGGSSDGSGTDIELALRAAQLTYAKVNWRGVDADLTAGAGAVDIRRLAIADLGGARITATGRLALDDHQPSGRMEAKVEAANLSGLVAVLRTSALPPALVDAVGARAGIVTPASLTAVLSSSGGGTGGATAKISGSLAGTTVELNASAPSFDLMDPVKAKLTATAADGARLFSQLGLPAIAVESFGPASLEASIDGIPSAGAGLEAVLTAGPDRLTFKGKTARDSEKRIVGRLDVNLEDAGRYAVVLGRAPPASLAAIPLNAGGDVTYGGNGLRVSRLAGLVDGRSLSGELRLGRQNEVQGEVEIASLSLAELAGMAVGPLALGAADASGWPSGPSGPGVLDGITGRINVRTDSFGIAPGYTSGKTKFVLALGRNEFSVQDIETTLAGGTVKGNFAIRHASADLSLAARLAVEGVALGEFVWRGHAGPAATGKLDLTADMLGTGRNLSAIVAGLTGSGSFTLRDASLAGVDAGAFERTLIAVENDTKPADAKEIGQRFGSELAMGDLEVSEISSAFTIASGVARASNAAISAPLVTATGSGMLDLSKKTLQASMSIGPKVLADLPETSLPHADLTLAGPWSAPGRAADTTAFANVLAVRAVEREIVRVEKMEAERRERERKAAEEEARRLAEEAKRKAEEEEAARLKAIREATGDIPLGDLPPPVDIIQPQPQAATPAPSESVRSPSPRRQSPLDFLRRPVAPEASR